MYLTYRSYYAYGNLTNLERQPTGAFFGYAKTVLQLLNKLDADYLAIARDLPEPTLRHKELVEYKANRKPMEDNLVSQLPLIDDFCDKITTNFFSLGGYEADDIINSLVTKYASNENEIYIMSGDRDLYQLFIHPNVYFVKEEKNYVELFGEQDFVKKYELNANQWVDYKALIGDGSDNFKGVPGVGPVTATKLLQANGSIYNLLGKLNIDNSKFSPGGTGESDAWIEDKKNATLIEKIKNNMPILEQSYMLSKLMLCDYTTNPLSKGHTFENSLELLEKNNMKTLVDYYNKNFGQKLIQDELF